MPGVTSGIVLGLVLSHPLGWMHTSATPTSEPPQTSTKPSADDEAIPEWLLRTQGASDGDAATPEPADAEAAQPEPVDQPLPEWLKRTHAGSDRDAGGPRAERNDEAKPWPTVPRRDQGAHAKKQPGEDGGFEMLATFGRAMVPLSRTTFSGSGVPQGGLTQQSFHATGSALGLHAPAFWTAELGVAYTRRYLSVGVLGAAGGLAAGSQQPPQDPVAASTFDAGSMALFGLAADVAGVLPVRPVTFRLGALAGVRALTAHLIDYERIPCGRDGYFSCEPTASATAPFFQPRATLDVTLGKGARVGALGAYLGMDLYPETAWSVGLSFSFRSPYWALSW